MDLRETTVASCTRHPWETVRLWTVRRILKKYMPLEKTLRILDIGCGDGWFLKHFLKPHDIGHGLDIYLSPENIKTQQGANATFFNSDSGLNGPYDIIFLMDVLEHIEDEKQFLTNIIEKYADQQTLFQITVPAYQSLFTSHDHFLHHYRRYNRTALNRPLEQAGLEVVAEGAMFFSLLLPRTFECLQEKLGSARAKENAGIGHWRHGKIFTKCVELFLKADNMLLFFFQKLGIPLGGLTLWVIARKRQP